jgi:UDP-N-acetylglucosamine 2-epimerase (non-hydrolysing)
MKKIFTIVGTRPNFIKVSQFKKHLHKPEEGYEHYLIHTGQHYDDKMSKVFFQQLNITPDYRLNVDPGTPPQQIGQIIIRLGKLFTEEKPDLVLVVGDVNSTLAAALAAHKCNIPYGHIESGLRSFDRLMPEENNRIITDELCDYFFITEPSGLENLLDEGKPKEKMFYVGNTMIDTLISFEKEIEKSEILQQLNIPKGKYILTTLHRPSNVDTREGIEQMLSILEYSAQHFPIVFPIHPRTQNKLNEFGLKDRIEGNDQIITLPPLDYFSFQHLIKYAAFVLTDSGGIQEETTFQQVPCLTLRPNTERPVTISEGSNVLLPFDLKEIQPVIQSIISGSFKKGVIPQYWDGKSSQRIAEAIMNAI